MKLIFRKSEGEMDVLIRTGTAEDEFSYVEMIKSLIGNNKFEDTEFDVSITDKEKESINELLSKINILLTRILKRKLNKVRHTIMYINNSRDRSKLKGFSSLQLFCNLTGKCHIIGNNSCNQRFRWFEKIAQIPRLVYCQYNLCVGI